MNKAEKTNKVEKMNTNERSGSSAPARTDWKQLYAERAKRARKISRAGGLQQAVEQGTLEQYCDITMNEILVLGLINQGVRTFVGIFGHGSTDLGEALRVYQAEGMIRVYSVHNETEASHAASLAAWKYGEIPAVFTSIGPGALHALAGSLVPQSNNLGVYYLLGDETTHDEGPNMQQIPRRDQNQYLELFKAMGKAYTLMEPNSVFTALKRGWSTVSDPRGSRPFYMLMPMNSQSRVLHGANLLEIPLPRKAPLQLGSDDELYREAARLIREQDRVVIKIGGGSRKMDFGLLQRFLEASGAALVHGPNVPGIIPYSHPQNMGVGGSKGSICGNYAMENAELLISIGARGVCQWDSSGTAWKQVDRVITVNAHNEDIYQYNRTVPLLGDASLAIERLLTELETAEQHETSEQREASASEAVSGEAASGAAEKLKTGKKEWLDLCAEKKQEWRAFKQERRENPVLPDEAFGCTILTQPAALQCTVDFAQSIGALKLFDAGDVQANGFQIVEDEKPGYTINDTGASYMGFAVSAMLGCAFRNPAEDYPIAFTGDGSFLMHPQILTDAVQYRLHGMIVIFDNRRMAAISSLQRAQYGKDFATNDAVAVDYVSLAESFSGVKGFFGGFDLPSLRKTLKQAYAHEGLSVVHVPVYFGDDPLGGLGVFGSWNVGNWCEEVQQEKHRIGL